jgi:hypothetical protein
MSKVIVYRAFARDTFPVAAATIATGWLPGQCFQLTSTGEYAQVAVTDGTMFVAVDDDLELSAPPTGSVMTGVYGSGTKIVIDHTEEVDAGSTTYAYSATGAPSAGSANADLYINEVGKWTTTSTGSVKGKMFQIPSAANNYSLGIILRF